VSDSKGEIFDPHHFILCYKVKVTLLALKSQSDLGNLSQGGDLMSTLDLGWPISNLGHWFPRLA
jgi:hypothetical protein